MTRVTRVYSSWALYTNLQLRGAPCTHQIHRFKMNHIHNELHPPPWWPSPGTLGVLQEADTPWPGPSCLEWPAGCSLWESLQKKSTSDFPIETLSKIEDFHGFPPHRWLPGAYWVYIWVWKFWTWHIPGQTDFFCWNLPSFWLNPNHLRLFGCSIFISWWIDSWLSLDLVRKRPRNQYWPNHSNSQSCCPANTQGLLLYNPFTLYYCFFLSHTHVSFIFSQPQE